MTTSAGVTLCAEAQYFEPFLSRHQHILEHYLVSYVHRTWFPWVSKRARAGPSVHHIANMISDQGLLMLSTTPLFRRC